MVATSTSLSPREAVAECLYRCLRGIDSNNRALFESSCLKTPEMIFVGGPVTFTGWDSINEGFHKLFEIVTTHVSSNVCVEVEDGADTAKLTCHTISYHIRPEEALVQEDTSYTASSLYDVELVKVEGDWKIKNWVANILWTTGDRAVLFP